ncbi:MULTISPECIES: preprotein translocase subunit SecG [Flavobacterium]|uniref:Protein-export membrane protein SecG n=1 Tax=Flavobacterium nitrogenifigens TaxID=1617283 RepID=A0A521EW72_9FLAO|nr:MULTISPECIES: preprotein translocase subunit SecG [Flavobacterium]KAF2082748.1 preprotein translocase subunit SecG [Flavobacterium sharifuzzamanii]KAF2333342.1 preprotein translocase subunit SecG [Flavobacterium nitrogenifigens]KAF2341775.1 preprotein translocase subunit SecG [Flavobacterium tistrianum]MDQ8011625.1 preprotein translocase subunit SecG [Flavobacterium nitrogenifigens]WDF64310.1 preprotein translocase subunit SecG [Flavobacterium sp. KACC 22763]
MSTFSIFLVLITIVCFLLIVVIMVQNPKGGGLSSTISGTQMLGGVQKTTDFLDKSTWTLATVLIVLILLSSLSFSGSLSDTESKIIDKTEAPANAPAAPAQGTTPAPATPAPAK